MPTANFWSPTRAVRTQAEIAHQRDRPARLPCSDYAGRLFSGLSLGSMLLLAALGLAITFGLMGVINMAHGEMLMIGAYATYVTQQVLRSHLPGCARVVPVVALPVAFIGGGAGRHGCWSAR